jgi:hypothetical protein
MRAALWGVRKERSRSLTELQKEERDMEIVTVPVVDGQQKIPQI